MKTVIRIEHPEDGIGIFVTREIGVILNDLASNLPSICSTFNYSVHNIGKVYDKHHSMDSARWIEGFERGKHYCAYPSVDIMKKWINCSEIKELIALGFIVLILDVEDYIETSEQVLYTKESVISSKDISSLFN
jgi:hypothetical protein